MEPLSPEWCAAWTAAAAGVELGHLEPFCVDEVIDGPAGHQRVRLSFDGQAFSLHPLGEGEPAPHATITLDAEAARALASGALSPAEALAKGLVKVSGDLGAVVAAQATLAAVGEKVAALSS